MKLLQQEMKDMYDSGNFILFAFRTIYEIKYSRNTQTFGLIKLSKNPAGLPYTKMGRFMALDPEDADNLIKN